MTDILIPGQTVCIGGVTGNHQANVGREILFGGLVTPRRPTVIVLTDAAHDDTIIRHFSIWAKARARSFTPKQIVRTDALFAARDDDHFFDLIDRAWKVRPSPSPIFYRDCSGETYRHDRWDRYAAELSRMYRSAVLTVASLGSHTLTAAPILDVPAQSHWTCEDNQRHVKLTSVESGDIIEFDGKAVHGGLVFNRKENAHAA